MSTVKSPTNTLAELSAHVRTLNEALRQVDQFPGTYEDAQNLIAELRLTRALTDIVRARRADLWRGEQEQKLEARRREKAASRERVRLAELDATRAAAAYAKQ